MKTIIVFYICLFFGLVVSPTIISGNEKEDSLKAFFFIKKERITGVTFKGNNERDQLLTDGFKTNEKLFISGAKFQFGQRFWNLLDYKQEMFDFTFETGPFTGTGDWLDSSKVGYLVADRKMFGLRNNVAINYSNRLYYDYSNYTLVEVEVWGRLDLFRRNTTGILSDSNFVEYSYDNTEYKDKLRYGFRAKAAVGFGRLNPVNNYMISEYLLDKFYKRRVSSIEEIWTLANEIGRIKNNRNVKAQTSTEKEIQQMNDFLRSKLMLKKPEDLEPDWKLGEFLPRFDGRRVEFGPFFNYYNREPGFVYGAYISMDYAKYVNYNWNNNISVNLSYNRYKRDIWVRDWMLLEADFGRSFYPSLRTQIDFGIKYLPGMVVNEFTDLEPISHNFIPYLKYYTQTNSKTRVDLTFAWIIADGEQFMQSGPELSVSIYRSRY